MTTADNSSRAGEVSSRTVELPPGVRHGTTTATAETWDAWDALTSEDGWEQRSWWVEKEAVIRGHRIVVFPPNKPRPVEQRPRRLGRQRPEGRS